MSSRVSLEEAQAKLAELIGSLVGADEIIITQNEQPVARLLPVDAPRPRRLGTMKGTVEYLSSDFDAPLDDFKDYTE